nr:two-component sensor histidine kinase [Paludibacter sp.]
GIGIKQRHLEKIWDVFYRVDASSAEAGEGLGLSLVKRIVEKHKGKIWAESIEGEGSIFYVELHKNEFEV